MHYKETRFSARQWKWQHPRQFLEWTACLLCPVCVPRYRVLRSANTVYILAGLFGRPRVWATMQAEWGKDWWKGGATHSCPLPGRAGSFPSGKNGHRSVERNSLRQWFKSYFLPHPRVLLVYWSEQWLRRALILKEIGLCAKVVVEGGGVLSEFIWGKHFLEKWQSASDIPLYSTGCDISFSHFYLVRETYQTY